MWIFIPPKQTYGLLPLNVNVKPWMKNFRGVKALTCFADCYSQKMGLDPLVFNITYKKKW